jgi:SAM-dependent methyltransferase
MRDRSDADWEALARKEPYFAVLTDERFLTGSLSDDRLREFFASGEADVQRLFDLASTYLGAPMDPKDTLDFGCGAGRLTLALARRAAHVVGVDAAPTMLQLASRHAAAAGVTNVELVPHLDALSNQQFDFICSLIVFQHIPVERGEALLRQLLGHLRPHGVIAVHFVFDRRGGALKRLARRLRAASPLLHRAVQALQREPLRLPYMQMNSYNRTRIVALMEEAGCRTPVLIPTDHGGMGGAIVIAEKAVRPYAWWLVASDGRCSLKH